MHTEIDPVKVRKVMAEFDRVGKKSFYAKYGGGKPKRYYVLHPDEERKSYPSAAIAQAALDWEDINGGYGTNYSACTMLERAGFRIIDTNTAGIVDEVEKRIDAMGVSERLAFIKVRIGQDVLRSKLLKIRDGQCEVTGISDLALLRASHIKPWASCDTTERWDTDNVLLLSALWDAAFDKGLVSFDEDGDPLYSSRLTREAKRSLRKTAEPSLWPTEDQCVYLRWHRENLFQP